MKKISIIFDYRFKDHHWILLKPGNGTESPETER
jgi:hypothetical protein